MARSSRKDRPSSLMEEGWWDRLTGRTRHLVCLAVLFVVAFAFYAPVVFSDQSLIGGDTVRWRAMAEYILAYEASTGQPALWAPNAFGGMPGYMISYGDRVPQLDVLPSLLRDIIWPVSHFIFLLIGTYLLAFYLTADRLAGLLSAAAYGLTTYLAIYLVAGHNSKFITLCFSPWLVLAFAYVLRKPKLLSALLFAMALGINLRAGHVQITYYVSFLLGIWWVVELVGAARRGAWRPIGAATGFLALGSVLGLFLVAQPYLAHFEYKQYTIRGAVDAAGAGLDWSYAMAWSQGVGELVTLIAADAFGGASPTYWGPKPFTSGPHYVGAIVFALAVLALVRVRRNVAIAFGVGTGVMILFSLGSHFPALNRLMYEYFPLFNAFRVPETWLITAAFAIAVLAGFGLHQAGRDVQPGGARAAYASFGGVAGLLLVLWLVPGIVTDFEKPDEAAQIAQQILAEYPDVSPDDPRLQATLDDYLQGQRGERAAIFKADMLRSLLFVLLAGGIVVLFRKGAVPRWSMQVLLALLVIVDLWGVGRRYFNEDFLVRADEPEEQIATYDFDRFLLQRQEDAGGMGRFRVVSIESGSPFQNARPSYHFESIGGYHGAKLSLMQAYIDDLFIDPATGAPNEQALDLLNVRYVVAAGELPGTRAVYQGEETGLYVLENPDALPRAFFVGNVEIVSDEEEAFSRLRSPGFDLRDTALLSEPIDPEPAAIDAGSTARVEIASYAPDEIVLDVETDAPRLLVLSEIYYPAGWKASIDGADADIVRANHLLRAVPVPEGAQQVVLRFDPASHRVGVWISAAATALVYGMSLALLGLAWYRRRDSAGEPPA